jgi:predicted DNA binding CopG/RHH family protein
MDKDLKLDIEEFNLDSEEIELLQNLENDYKPIANQEEAIERYSQIAKDNISKRRAINIKVLASDLEKIK